MLQGTFETLTLTELLATLAAARKTGVLELDAPDADARVHLREGRCIAAETDVLTDPLTDVEALEARLVEACFAVARQRDGRFRFVADAEPPWSVEPAISLDEVVVAVDELIDQWDELRDVIPSLDAHPRLRGEIAEPITLRPGEWQLIAAVDGRRSVQDVADRTRQGALDVCRALAALVERGAVQIDPPRPRSPIAEETARSRAALEAVTAALPVPRGTAAELTDPWAPGVDSRYTELHRRLAEQELVPADPPGGTDADAHEEDDDVLAIGAAATGEEQTAAGDDGRDRRALMRLFSALREG